MNPRKIPTHRVLRWTLLRALVSPQQSAPQVAHEKAVGNMYTLCLFVPWIFKAEIGTSMPVSVLGLEGAITRAMAVEIQPINVDNRFSVVDTVLILNKFMIQFCRSGYYVKVTVVFMTRRRQSSKQATS